MSRGSHEAVVTYASESAAEFGRIDILVANAGIERIDVPCADCTEARLDHVFEGRAARYAQRRGWLGVDLMADAVLTRERILESAEDVLRRFGPAKATVVDVARALGVSHGSVYRHFPSKAALVDAVVERWLEEVALPLATVSREGGPATDRLIRWLDLLVASKRRRALEDPELFATYVALTAEARDVVRAHVDALVGQLAQIIADGIEQGVMDEADAGTSARAVFDATARFHNPINAASWTDVQAEAAYRAVRSLVLAGLGLRPAPLT